MAKFIRPELSSCADWVSRNLEHFTIPELDGTTSVMRAAGGFGEALIHILKRDTASCREDYRRYGLEALRFTEAAIRSIRNSRKTELGVMNANRDRDREVFTFGPFFPSRASSIGVPVGIFKRYSREKMRDIAEICRQLYFEGLPIEPISGVPFNDKPEILLAIYVGPNLMEHMGSYSGNGSSRYEFERKVWQDTLQRTLDLAGKLQGLRLFKPGKGRVESLKRIEQNFRTLGIYGDLRDGPLEAFVSTYASRAADMLEADEDWPFVDMSWRNVGYEGNTLWSFDADRFGVRSSRAYNLVQPAFQNFTEMPIEGRLEDLSFICQDRDRLRLTSFAYLVDRISRGIQHGLPVTQAVPVGIERAQLEKELEYGRLMADDPVVRRHYPEPADIIRGLPTDVKVLLD